MCRLTASSIPPIHNPDTEGAEWCSSQKCHPRFPGPLSQLRHPPSIDGYVDPPFLGGSGYYVLICGQLSHAAPPHSLISGVCLVCLFSVSVWVGVRPQPSLPRISPVTPQPPLGQSVTHYSLPTQLHAGNLPRVSSSDPDDEQTNHPSRRPHHC